MGLSIDSVSGPVSSVVCHRRTSCESCVKSSACRYIYGPTNGDSPSYRCVKDAWWDLYFEVKLYNTTTQFQECWRFSASKRVASSQNSTKNVIRKSSRSSFSGSRENHAFLVCLSACFAFVRTKLMEAV